MDTKRHNMTTITFYSHKETNITKEETKTQPQRQTQQSQRQAKQLERQKITTTKHEKATNSDKLQQIDIWNNYKKQNGYNEV